MYSHFKANSNQTWVSQASDSESFNFEIKALGYRLFLQASPILAHTEREERLI